MKLLNTFNYQVSKIDRRHIQLALLMITIALLVVGAGAPGDFGDYASLKLSR